jgi:hypothetical protein
MIILSAKTIHTIMDPREPAKQKYTAASALMMHSMLLLHWTS